MSVRHKNISGKRFGRWFVLHRSGRNKHQQALWLCRCDCGNESEVSANSLVMGNSLSCGCLHYDKVSTHGMSSTLEHRSWYRMISRCTKASNNRYDSYAGRGITVCERWMLFENFLADMGECPGDGYSIERNDNNGSYAPGNCRWATDKEQARNRRSTFYVIFNGERRSLAEHAESCGVSYKTAWKRIRYYGWTPQQALTNT